MALRLVIGRSGTGKTTLCLDEIRGMLRQAADGPPLVMLVPEQATFQTEYALLAGGQGLRGTLRAQALSFRRLAFRVMQETGGTALVPIDDTGKHMLLYKTVLRLSERLELFRAGAEQPGFIERLAELLTEWKRYGVDSGRVTEALQAGGPDPDSSEDGGRSLLDRKLRDLALIYGEMERELAGRYIDSEDYLQLLKEGFPAAPSMRGAHIWVDGFHGFTPAEYGALGEIMASAADMTVTLTLDRPYAAGEAPHELDLFHPAAETCLKLLELAEQRGVQVLEPVVLNASPAWRFNESPMLAHLEKHYGMRVPMAVAGPSFRPDSPACGVSLHAAGGRRAEVDAVARDMIRRASDEGLRWRQLAVMVRNAEDYAGYIAQIFEEYGIPYYIDQKKKAQHHPLVEFIRSAFETVLYGWRYDAVFRCVKTELLYPRDGSLPRESFDLLENYVLAAGIDGRKWLDKKAWKPLVPPALEEETAMETAVPERARRELEIALAAREAVVPLLRRFGDNLRKAADVKQMCEALYRLLDHADAADLLEQWSRDDMAKGQSLRARSHRQLWDNVMSLLDQLAELAGDQQVAPELFAGMVEAGLDSLKLASVPPALDQVLVGSMDRTRSADIAVCYVLGANDGLMPARTQEDGILTEAERELLEESGVRMAPGARRRLLDERFMIYNALTKPGRHLWVSWAQADEEGKALLPSEIVRMLKGLYPGIPVYDEPLGPSPDMPEEEQLPFVMRPESALSHMTAMVRAWRQGKPVSPIWWDVYNWFAVRPEWQPRLRLMMSSLVYDNREDDLSVSTASLLYGERMKASVSRMERFVSCPFQHFAIHGLKLRERKLHRLAAPDVGQLFHAALSKLAGELGPRWGKLGADDLKAAAVRAVDALAPKLQSEILLSSGRFQYIARKLKEIVAQAAVILGEHAGRAEFVPVGTEVDFGPGGTLPSLVIRLDDGSELEIIGRIDRVDAAQTSEGLLLRVLDYKSSATALKLEEVIHGLSLQMLTYLDVLMTHAQDWLGQPASPAGVLYFHVHNPLLQTSGRLSREEAAGLLLKRYKMKGLVTADASVVKRMDSRLETGYSDMLPVALKRDGSFYSSASVVTEEQWDTLRRAVRRSIGRIGSSIRRGRVAIEPYRMGGKTPCQYCDYKAVCQFDPLFPGNDYAKLRKTGKDEVWQQLEERLEEERETT